MPLPFCPPPSLSLITSLQNVQLVVEALFPGVEGRLCVGSCGIPVREKQKSARVETSPPPPTPFSLPPLAPSGSLPVSGKKKKRTENPIALALFCGDLLFREDPLDFPSSSSSLLTCKHSDIPCGPVPTTGTTFLESCPLSWPHCVPRSDSSAHELQGTRKGREEAWR